MLLDFTDLPAGTTAETVRLGAGKSFTFYHLPDLLTQGPEARVDSEGRKYLLYMWNLYLFVWPQSTGTVSVYHGDLNDHSAEPLWSFNLDQRWSVETLVAGGRKWAALHDSQFLPPAVRGKPPGQKRRNSSESAPRNAS
jgi:hypothetical protein